MSRKHDSDLTDTELAAWKLASPTWPRPGWPSWQQYQEWIREIGWRAAAVQAADLEFTQHRKRGAA